MSIKMLMVMVICLGITMPVIILIVNKIDRMDKAKYNIGSSMYTNGIKRNPFIDLYKFFIRFWLTRGYFEKISRRYELLCPGNIREISDKTMTTALISIIISVIEIIFIYLFKPNLHNGVLVLFLIYVSNNEIMNYLIGSAEIRLLESMQQFISEVGHNYHINHLVDDSILLSMEELSKDMKVHAMKLHEVVVSTNLKEEVIRYNTTMHNRYLKMFLSLCVSVLDYSDKKMNGQLLFATNLMHLKREINIEILKLKKLRHVFAGTVFVTIAVCIPIDAIQKFGISMVPELETFYTGYGGTLFISIIFLSSILVYLFINHAKEMNNSVVNDYRYLKKLESITFINKALDNYTEKHYGKMQVLRDTLKRLGETMSPRQFLLKRMVAAIVSFLICLILVLYIHDRNRELITNKVNNIERITSSVNVKQQVIMKDTILKHVNQYKKDTLTQEQIEAVLIKEGTYSNEEMNQQLAKEILTRIKNYKSEYFRWYELLICIGISMIAFQIPYIILIYRKRVMIMVMEDEVNQFNSIIHMMMYIDHVTVMDLLRQMELFAVVFKRSIQECMNNYNSGDLEALTQMKERENFGPFIRLTNNLIRCDVVPIDKAFDEIASERENYHDKRKQENEISIQRRADTVKPLSFIPAVLVTIYLLLPMLASGLNMLEEFRKSVTTMGF